MGETRLRAGVWREAQRERTHAGSLVIDARRPLRPHVPGDEELLRAEGLQLLRSLRAVRRSSRRPHRWRARLRAKMAGGRAASLGRARAHAARAHPARLL